jgi:hypothetical protein
MQTHEIARAGINLLGQPRHPQTLIETFPLSDEAKLGRIRLGAQTRDGRRPLCFLKIGKRSACFRLAPGKC